MLYALCPAQIADVDQAVNAFFNFDECAEVGQVTDADWPLVAAFQAKSFALPDSRSTQRIQLHRSR